MRRSALVLYCLLAVLVAAPAGAGTPHDQSLSAGPPPGTSPSAPPAAPTGAPAPGTSSSTTPTTSGAATRSAQTNCPALYRPVCARRGGKNRTYTNSCHAAASKALVIAQGRCPDRCTKIYQPTCAVDDNGRRHTYSSICEATVAGARFVHAGRCRGR
jgi:hypothetical protein